VRNRSAQAKLVQNTNRTLTILTIIDLPASSKKAKEIFQNHKKDFPGMSIGKKPARIAASLAVTICVRLGQCPTKNGNAGTTTCQEK
jgi:hypothetical protein